MSPALSWVLFGACIVVGLVVYVVVAGGRRYRRMEQQWCDETFTSTDVEDAHVRIFGGPYDHEARGDFAWTFDHDPLTDGCEVCAGRRRRAFNRLADRPGTPRDADELMAAIREELE
jgi:hypothetical protein